MNLKENSKLLIWINYILDLKDLFSDRFIIILKILKFVATKRFSKQVFTKNIYHFTSFKFLGVNLYRSIRFVMVAQFLSTLLIFLQIFHFIFMMIQ